MSMSAGGCLATRTPFHATRMSSCVIKLTAGLSALVTSTGTGSRGTSGTSGRAEGRDVAGLTALSYARRGGPDELVRIQATIRDEDVPSSRS